MTKNNEKQAYLPEDCVILGNAWGTAPGCAFESEGKHVIMLPGPPRECKPMFYECAIPYLMKLSNEIILSKNIRVFNMGESAMEDKLRDMMVSMTNPTIAPYAKEGECFVRVTAKAKDKETAEAMMAPVVDKVLEVLGEVVYGIDVNSLEEVVVSGLIDRKLTLSTAESCTGGYLSKRITDISGASGCFPGGVCTYSNEIKHKILGVDLSLIAEKGAVSEEVAVSMAKKVRALFGTDVGVGITGIAGPSGGSERKPVGLVYIAVDCKDGTFTREQRWGRDRERVRRMAASHALDLIRQNVLK